MAGMVLEAFQEDPGANDAHDAWLSRPVKTFQTGPGPNDADDAWLAWFLKALQEDTGANDAHDAWLSWSMKTRRKSLGANDADDAWLSSSDFQQMVRARPGRGKLYRNIWEQSRLKKRGLPSRWKLRRKSLVPIIKQ